MRWFIAVIVMFGMMVSVAQPQAGSDEMPEPIQELRLLVVASPGGGYDRTAQAVKRTLLADGLVESVNLDYSPGAGGLIGLAQFVEADPSDGLTLLITGRTSLGATLHNRSKVSVKDAAPIARLVSPSSAVIVPSGSSFQSFGDLAGVISEDADLISWYGGSVGSFDELVVRVITSTFGGPADQASFNAVPGGGDKIIEQIENSDLSVAVSSYEEVSEAVESGRVRILALSDTEASFQDNAPTFSQLGIPLAEVDWRGAFAHPLASERDRAALEDLMATLSRSESWKTETQQQFWADAYMDSADFAAFIDADWALIQAKSVAAESDGADTVRADNILRRRQRMVQFALVAIIGLTAILGALFWVFRRQRKKWHDTFDEFTEETRLMQEKLDKSHSDMAAHINGDFDKWHLTDAENEIGWMLLKGLSFREIALARGRSERTVRQQAQSIYAKSKLQSRSDLAAHFLEDFVFGAAEPKQS